MSELAKRAVACKHWRFMPGMLVVSEGVVDPTRLIYRGLDSWWSVEGDDDSAFENVPEYPDLTDPATLGCLLHLVREAWGDSNLCIEKEGLWYMKNAIGNTEAEALVAALEAAP